MLEEPLRPVPPPAARALPLDELAVGVVARLVDCDLPALESRLLAAMGLALGCRVVVRGQGDPTIVEVRSTRIGLARSVAARLRVAPEAPAT